MLLRPRRLNLIFAPHILSQAFANGITSREDIYEPRAFRTHRDSVLPLRDVVVYPHMVIPLFVGREKSIRCLEAAMEQDKKVLLVAQKDASTDEPTVEEIFSVGTVANILQMLKLPDGTVKVLVVEGPACPP